MDKTNKEHKNTRVFKYNDCTIIYEKDFSGIAKIFDETGHAVIIPGDCLRSFIAEWLADSGNCIRPNENVSVLQLYDTLSKELNQWPADLYRSEICTVNTENSYKKFEDFMREALSKDTSIPSTLPDINKHKEGD